MGLANPPPSQFFYQSCGAVPPQMHPGSARPLSCFFCDPAVAARYRRRSPAPHLLFLHRILHPGVNVATSGPQQPASTGARSSLRFPTWAREPDENLPEVVVPQNTEADLNRPRMRDGALCRPAVAGMPIRGKIHVSYTGYDSRSSRTAHLRCPHGERRPGRRQRHTKMPVRRGVLPASDDATSKMPRPENASTDSSAHLYHLKIVGSPFRHRRHWRWCPAAPEV